jgi:hypothetical protein
MINIATTKRMVMVITPLPDLKRLDLTKNMKGIMLENTAKLITWTYFPVWNRN